MDGLLKVESSIPAPGGRPRTEVGDVAANLQAGDSVLFEDDRNAERFRDCVRYYHGSRNASIRKVPRKGWRVWRTK